MVKTISHIIYSITSQLTALSSPLLSDTFFQMSFPGRAVQRTWHLIDATNQTVGRLATTVAPILKGKHKPTYRPNADIGDYVVIVNADKVGFIFCLSCLFILLESHSHEIIWGSLCVYVICSLQFICCI